MTRRATPPAKLVRCAIYTRKSSEEGLDQAFNSLHAQREACEAYVKSQAAEGWGALAATYDDGGYSGGTMERPGLQRLLADVDSGRIDIVVVYKVDRLTRSLADFARIVDRLDAAGASFVSVTQAFNTTTSMGRLTLNVLLSFAQFEREVTGERIRDKIAASKARGMWMGGNLPLGYDAPTDRTTRALAVNPEEAEVVRTIFRTYLELGSAHALEAHLEASGVRSKRWTSKAGKVIGGARLSRGALFHLLQNRVYLGEIPHRDTSYPGCHPPIIDLELFDQVQALLESHRRAWKARPVRSATMPLRGILFDADGHPMTPTFTRGRKGQIYRYYVSAPLQLGRKPRIRADALRRVAAPEIEAILARELSQLLRASPGERLEQLLPAVKRIELEGEALRITLDRVGIPRASLSRCEPSPHPEQMLLELPIRCRLRGGRTWIMPAGGTELKRPARRDPVLIRGLQQAHRLVAAMGWSAADGSVEAANTKAPVNAYERKLCRMAFLAPDIQRMILQGRQPPELNLENLVHGAIATSWTDQRRALGLAEG
jgi:DNA invertase Pin-like site-specific DNA recombinase